MVVRNFWISAGIDGRATRIESGPRAADGGLELVVEQRHEGAVERVLEIRGFALADGRLRLDVVVPRKAVAFARYVEDDADGYVSLETVR